MSTGRTTRDVHNYLKSIGWESYIVTPKYEDSDDAFTFTNQNKKYIDVALSTLTGLEGVFSKSATRKLIKHIDTVKPDIIHLRVLHLYFMDFNMLFKYIKKHNISVVITLHDFWWMTGLCPYYTKTNCEKWKTGCGKCPNLIINKRRPLFDATHKNWLNKQKWINGVNKLAIVGVSKWAADEAKSSLLNSASKITYIYNWIDLDIFKPVSKENRKEIRHSLGFSDDDKIILGVSTNWQEHDRKGLDYYIEISKSIPKNYKIVLIGNLQNKDLLKENIIFIDPIYDINLLSEYYIAADVYLNLSIEETFGKVSAEAISCGTPVVAINSTANPEIVPKGGGVIINSLNIAEISDALSDVLSKEKESYESILRKHAEENFDKEKNLKKYIELYEELWKKQ